ncbi:MAG: SIS domain-containing protein [Candidatus Methylomirabilales bacterium]
MKVLTHQALQAALEETQTGVALLQEGLERQEESVEKFMDLLIDVYRENRKIFLFAPGRSGLVAQAFCSRLAQMGLRAHIVGTLTTPAIGPDDLLILLSSSGKTRLTLFMRDLGRTYGGKLAVITANPDAPLAEGADAVLVVPTLTRRKLPLGSFTEQMIWVLLDGLIVEFLRRLEINEETLAKNHPNLE